MNDLQTHHYNRDVKKRKRKLTQDNRLMNGCGLAGFFHFWLPL